MAGGDPVRLDPFGTESLGCGPVRLEPFLTEFSLLKRLLSFSTAVFCDRAR